MTDLDALAAKSAEVRADPSPFGFDSVALSPDTLDALIAAARERDMLVEKNTSLARLMAKWDRAMGTMEAERDAARAEVAALREQVWDEALRWVRAQADVTSPDYVLDRIDRAEPFNPYRAKRCCPDHNDCHLPGEMVCCDACPDRAALAATGESDASE